MDAISYAYFDIDLALQFSLVFSYMKLEKKFKIGILGAGQLGCFLAKVCQKESIPWCIYYENNNDPGLKLFPQNAIKLHKEIRKRKTQLEKCEILILESEFYSYDELKNINSIFIPDINSYKNFYGKINQRLFYHSLGLNCPKFLIVNDITELDMVDIFPVILKKNLLSYDGIGNRECNNLHELHKSSAELGFPLLIEEKLIIKKEFAVGIVSNGKDTIQLPLTETYFKNHICHFVLGPFYIENKYLELLNIELEKLLKCNFIGLYAFEFFITEDDKVIINEGAARPHNSQHLTMNLCENSQFEYIIDLALRPASIIPCKLKAPLGAMINLLGKINGKNPTLKLTDVPPNYPYEVYMYGKEEGRIGRKLGHLNILASDTKDKEFIKILDEIYEGYQL